MLSLAVAIAVALAVAACYSVYAPSITQPYIETRTYKKCARAIAMNLCCCRCYLKTLLLFSTVVTAAAVAAVTDAVVVVVVVLSVLFRSIIRMYTKRACCMSLVKQYNGMKSVSM